LIDLGIDKIRLKLDNDKIIDNDELKKFLLFVEKLDYYNRKLQKHKLSLYMLEYFIKNFKKIENVFVSAEKMERTIAEIQEFYKERLTSIIVEAGEEPNTFKFNCIIDGQKFDVTSLLLNSKEIKEVRRFYLELSRYSSKKYTVVNSDTNTGIEYSNYFDAYFDIINNSKKGVVIQRYKGLGEMNPEQLWETTMNPDNRTLLKVNIADNIAANEIFSILMGDNVEPRRDFIQQYAQEARNIDV